MPDRDISSPALLAALLLACAAAFTGITRGLPSSERLGRVFESAAQIEANAGLMLAARDAHYEKAENVRRSGSVYVGQAMPGKARRPAAAEEIPAAEAAGSLRSFFLGSFVGDETWSVSILSRMRPAELDLNPRTLMYGGAYIYTLCAMLGTAALAGYLPLSSGAAYFLYHPEKAAAVFIVLRTLSALSLAASVLLLFRTVRERMGASAALAASTLCVLAPTVVYHGHVAKPHVYAMLWSLLTFHYALRIAEEGRKRYYVLGGAAAGLALGTLLPNALVFSSLLFAEHARTGSVRGTLNRNVLLALLCAAAAFFLTNPYAAFSGLLASTIGAANSAYSYGAVRLSDMPRALGVLFSGAVNWTYAPLLAAGTVCALRSYRSFGRVLALTAWTFISGNLLFLRHPGPFCSAVPFIAVLCVIALRDMFSGGAALKAAARAWLALTLAAAGWGAFAVVRDFCETPNLQKAGEWINAEVPRGSSIGLPGSEDLRPAVSPYMRFLDYRLYRMDPTAPTAPDALLPEYIAVTGFARKYVRGLEGFLEERYSLEKEFARRRGFIPALAEGGPDFSPQTDVYIYRLRAPARRA